MGKRATEYLQMLRTNKAFKTHLQKWNIFYSVRIKKHPTIYTYTMIDQFRLGVLRCHPYRVFIVGERVVAFGVKHPASDENNVGI